MDFNGGLKVQIAFQCSFKKLWLKVNKCSCFYVSDQWFGLIRHLFLSWDHVELFKAALNLQPTIEVHYIMSLRLKTERRFGWRELSGHFVFWKWTPLTHNVAWKSFIPQNHLQKSSCPLWTKVSAPLHLSLTVPWVSCMFRPFPVFMSKPEQCMEVCIRPL